MAACKPGGTSFRGTTKHSAAHWSPSRAAPTRWWVRCSVTQPIQCIAGVIFFNNSGCLGMCGHGTIGVVATLAYLGRIKPGRYRIETPVGIVGATLNEDGTVTVENVPVPMGRRSGNEVPGYGKVTGDVAWGGNWFFLVRQHPYTLNLANLEQLMDFTWAIRQALTQARFEGRRMPKLITSSCTARGRPRTLIAGTLCSVLARSTTGPLAGLVPAPSWPACMRIGSSLPDRCGARKV